MVPLLVTVTAIVAAAGLSVAVWTIVVTRQRYYRDYLDRKHHHE